MRPCIEPGCTRLTKRTRCATHQQQRDARRNADPRRIARYGGDWPAERAAIIAAQPWCSICYTAYDLTVDHDPNGGRNVFCRSDHAKVEARRRAQVDGTR
jgi:hypothetical protein